MSDDPTQTPDPVNDKTETPPDKGGTDAPTFTQAELDKHIADRLKRDRDAQQTKFLESLGVTSLEEAKSALDAKRKADEAQLSELDKAQKAIEQANQARQAAEQRVTEMETRIRDDQRKQVFTRAIAEGGGNNPEDLFILVTAKYGEDFQAVFKEDATPDEAKLKAFVKQVQSSFSNYFGSAGAGSPPTAHGTAPTSLQKAAELAEKEIESKFGNL